MLNAEQLWKASGQWSCSLAARRTGSNEFVVLAMSQSAEFFAALLGIWQAGFCALVVDPQLSRSERAIVSNFAKPVGVIGGEGTNWPSPIVVKSKGLSVAPQAIIKRASEEPALALLTSGTTGLPKIVILSFGALASRLQSNIHAVGKTVFSTTLQTLSFAFGHGLIGSALTTLMAGGRLVIPPSGPASALKLGALIDQHNVTFLTSVPAYWHMVLKAAKRPMLATLQRIHVGSAPLSIEHWKRIQDWCGCDVFNCYGMTETANWVAFQRYAEAVKQGAVGQATDGQFALLDASGKIVDQGNGEVLVKTPGLMTEYFNQPSATESAFKDGWFRTGDIGELGKDGNLRLTGRSKEMINRAGAKVFPSEVDHLLESHPGIVEACSFSIPDAISGETVGAAIVLHPEVPFSQKELTKWCQERARKELVPEQWFVVESLCRSERGKLDRRAQMALLIGSN